MGTRSSIAILNNDGTVDAVYCHWDGYLSHNGKILFEHYSTANKVRSLLSFGHLSSLGENIGPTDVQPSPERFDNPPRNECTFYGRDRGEEDQKSQRFQDTAKWIAELGQSYNYLFCVSNNTWVVSNYRNAFEELSAALAENDE